MRYSIFILLVSAVFTFAGPLHKSKINKCGYEACGTTDLNTFNVHIVAHSHDDVGWLKTVDQYYYGSESRIQLAGVQYIIDSVIRALKANPSRKYIQVESAFFYKWWFEQDDPKKSLVTDLINNGQLEMVGGAWSMNDEAAAHYHSIIDQFTLGLKFIKDTFPQSQECARPKIGWQIDPFGHTREMASMFAQMGYDALFFARLDWRDKGERLKTKTGEMLWRGSANLGSDSLLFTHVLYNHYSPPSGFYFDVLSEDDPLIPDEDSSEYNLAAKVKDFTAYVNKQMQNYTTNNIIITMGNDFTYQDAHYSYKNLDILIQAFEDLPQQDSQGRRIKLFYSTPACYIKAVHDYAEANDESFKVKTDDFIPYASDYHTYWSGYYTSRPTQKRFERQGNNFLQVTKQLTAFSGANPAVLNENLDDLRAAMGIMQHHDAITGTEKQAVAQDYARLVMKAFDKSHKNINEIIPQLLNKNSINIREVNLEFKTCLLANVSVCETSQAEEFVVAIHNPLSRKVSHHVRLPVDLNKFKITTSGGEDVLYQILPSIDNFAYLPESLKPSKYELVFLAKDLPPLGIKLYHIKKEEEAHEDIVPEEGDERFTLGDENYGVFLNPRTGLMREVRMGNEVNVVVRQNLMYYIGAQGNNEVFSNRSSGAYIFRPDVDNPTATSFTDSVIDSLKVYKGDIVDEAHQKFNEWNKQIIRVYKNQENHVELDWLVGPIDDSDQQSREIISRFTSNLVTPDRFYTDSNGREMITRRNNYRATYTYSDEEPVAGNYYPVTSSISTDDPYRSLEMAVLNDRAQGGASLEAGQIELMVHRRTLKDDAFGVGEALKEDEFGRGLVVRGQHYLTVGTTASIDGEGYSRRKMRDIAQRKLLAPWVLIADATTTTLQELQNELEFQFQGLTRDLPYDVQILTLEPWAENQVLLRLENIFEINEGGKEVTIDLKGLFTLFEVDALEETTLGANQNLDDNQRLKWNVGECLPGLDDCTDAPNATPKHTISKNPIALDDIVLKPMQIRTFIATVTFRETS